MKDHKVIILRGLPGAGKTELCKALQNHIYVSMDDYWTRDGQPYRFEKSEMRTAVAWTHTKFYEALRDGQEKESALIVVDNTHTRTWEMDFYYDAASRAGWDVQFVRVEADIMVCMKRCQHPVPAYKMLEMRDRFEDLAPKDMESRVRLLEEIGLALTKIDLEGRIKKETKNG